MPPWHEPRLKEDIKSQIQNYCGDQTKWNTPEEIMEVAAVQFIHSLIHSSNTGTPFSVSNPLMFAKNIDIIPALKELPPLRCEGEADIY